ncbi:hypothetical protein HispidOSU_022999 [Sigmodon hispidus]
MKKATSPPRASRPPNSGSRGRCFRRRRRSAVAARGAARSWSPLGPRARAPKAAAPRPLRAVHVRPAPTPRAAPQFRGATWIHPDAGYRDTRRPQAPKSGQPILRKPTGEKTPRAARPPRRQAAARQAGGRSGEGGIELRAGRCCPQGRAPGRRHRPRLAPHSRAPPAASPFLHRHAAAILFTALRRAVVARLNGGHAPSRS